MSWTNIKIDMTGPLAAPALTRVIEAVAQDGDEALIVGGAVRNSLLGRPVSDVDIATTAVPDHVISRATRAGLKTVPTGIEHGTVTIVVDGRGYEVTTLRRDVDTDGRRATVEFGRDFIGDAHRRDFTINGLYARLDGTVFDPVGGLSDIAKRRVCFIGDPEKRIREDYLRILRFFRFFGEFDEGDADSEALAAIAAEREGLNRLSRERVRSEFLKILCVRRASDTMSLLEQYKILDLILNEAATPEIFSRSVGLFPELPAIARLSALLDQSDIDQDRIQQRLRLSNEEARDFSGIKQALAMMGLSGDRLKDQDLRRVAFKTGKRHALAALIIRSARENRAPDRHHIETIDHTPQISPLTGELMISLGVKPGPQMGKIIEDAENMWIEAGMSSDPNTIRDIANRAIMVN